MMRSISQRSVKLYIDLTVWLWSVDMCVCVCVCVCVCMSHWLSQ